MLCAGVAGIVVSWVEVRAVCLGATTLGACIFPVVDVTLVFVVGVGVSCVGVSSTLLSCVAISNSAFQTGSPASKLGTVVAGGFVRIN